MYDSILSPCQDGKHLHFIHVTDGYGSFQYSGSSLVINSLIFSDLTVEHIFTHIVLMGFCQNLSIAVGRL